MKNQILKGLFDDDGQSMVETAITFPVYLLIILCFIQITLIMNAKFIVNYAAYCAVRTGIVNNGDVSRARSAAGLALSTLYTNTNSIQNIILGQVQASLPVITSVERKASITSDDTLNLSTLPGNPARPDPDNGGRLTVFFDDARPAAVQARLLTMEVTHWYKLTVPLADRIIFSIFHLGSWAEQREIYLPEYRFRLSSRQTMRMQSDLVQ